MDTRDTIIQNSFILFLKYGIKEVSIKEIINACGVSKGAFYHHFESKESVYMEVLNRFFFSYFKKQKVYYAKEVSLEEKLNRFIQSFLDPYEEIAKLLNTDQLTAYFRFLFQASSTYDEVRKRINKHFYRKGYYLYQILEIAKEQGEIRAEVNSEASARHVFSMLIGVTILDGIYTLEAMKEHIRLGIFNYISLIK
ncbi:MAG: TetR/AcrR family transcriptional regulator [Bacteroidales bacterium]|nr:TetR/AcrR family transcriptional regulator [Bacteroidales bacterium]